MSPRWRLRAAIAAIVIIAAFVTGVILHQSGQVASEESTQTHEPPATVHIGRELEAVARVAPRDDSGVNYLPEITEKAGGLNAPGSTAHDDIAIIEDLLGWYSRLVRKGNPSGLNHDIVRQMQGANPAKLAVLPRIFPGLTEDGEIADRWGTPYFFHCVSDRQIEIRSAGPDRKFWTEDDIATPEFPIKATVSAAPAFY
jgi:hypothetical protein